MKKLGFYKDLRGPNLPSLSDLQPLVKRGEPLDEAIQQYLNAGIWLYKMRTQFTCPMTSDFIGTPVVYTDGEWFWTTEYIFYVNRYQIDIPDDFLLKMKSSSFKVPTESELGEEALANLQEEIRNHGYK